MESLQKLTERTVWNTRGEKIYLKYICIESAGILLFVCSIRNVTNTNVGGEINVHIEDLTRFQTQLSPHIKWTRTKSLGNKGWFLLACKNESSVFQTVQREEIKFCD